MSQSRQFPCRIDRVVDGDTIDVTADLGFHVRISLRVDAIKADAPETRTRDLEEKAAGLRTKERVEQLCPVGSWLTLRSDEIGKYGRVGGRA